MPTYRFACDTCGGAFEQWLSIHTDKADHPKIHPGCGGEVSLMITRVATYGVGDRGAVTRSADAREKRIFLDRGAYKRFRDDGHQPLQMTGSHELEAKATDDWYVKTGGLVSVPDDRNEEINEMLADGQSSDWDPIEEVHRKRAKA